MPQKTTRSPGASASMSLTIITPGASMSLTIITPEQYNVL
ncbi:hypothetical protein LTSEUGA_4496 [Salmonella enterica subsp. enterica serovar Uganda str. R8-3404]|uniref:Uncharacterized protein n=1 Tax=Salmonella enterica subsp. enterica serovar Uganda str. R8-3404 TaxID=913083 RepID=A0A6C8GXL3_SALET|nr:hypothetical protein LTSEUGA_4496 [Salmonella enterica subsp. enterica serovar Uganda str. R8-3404]